MIYFPDPMVVVTVLLIRPDDSVLSCLQIDNCNSLVLRRVKVVLSALFRNLKRCRDEAEVVEVI